jgi:hypothetical protein
MEVVRNPADGALALAPKDALDRQRERARVAGERAGGGLLPAGRSAASRGPQRRQHGTGSPRGGSRRGPVSAVPNFATGLPKRRPPWEGGGDSDEDEVSLDDLDLELDTPALPRAATRRPEPPSEPMELSSVERQGIAQLAREVHGSVQRADEPEEFVHKMMEKYPLPILQQIVGSYSDRQIVQGIVQLEPTSAGATPAGRDFVMKAFRMIRERVASA